MHSPPTSYASIFAISQHSKQNIIRNECIPKKHSFFLSDLFLFRQAIHNLVFKMAPNTDIATRALVVALKSPHGGGKSSAEISRNTGLSVRLINQIYTRAIERGFEPNTLPMVIRDEWLKDSPRSGRPTKRAPDTKQKLQVKVHLDHSAAR